ncbi:ABC transporter permease, partial [Staphylococcus aureus]
MKYLLKGNILLLLLILLTIISLFIGVSELSIKDLLHLTE